MVFKSQKVMKKIFLTGAASVLLLTACNKNEQVAEKSLEQQKIDFQQRQLEIEKQKLAIERERIAYETQRKSDSIAEAKQTKTAASAAARPQVIRETVYVNNPAPAPRRSSSSTSSSSGTYANNSGGTVQQAPARKGISHKARGAIVGTATGAAAGAILNKNNRGGGAVVGGIIGGLSGYAIGNQVDKRQGR